MAPLFTQAGSSTYGGLHKSKGPHGSSAALVEDTHCLGDHEVLELGGGHPTIPAAFLPGTQKIPGMGDKGRLGFFFFLKKKECGNCR